MSISNNTSKSVTMKPSLFENSRGYKSSSIILEYIFFIILILIILYSIYSTKDIPTNTMILLKWLGIAITCSTEGYKINERICDVRESSNNNNRSNL